MFDLDEAFHCLQTLDVRGRKALRLCDLMWQEIHDAAGGHPPNPLTRRYLAELSERTEEVRVLRERLADALDGREAAESQLERVRALATHWGLDTELDRALADWRPHCRRQPRSPLSWDDERIDQLNAKVQSLRRESKAAREAQFVAIDRMQQERLRAEAAEGKAAELRSEVRALYYRKGRP